MAEPNRTGRSHGKADEDQNQRSIIGRREYLSGVGASLTAIAAGVPTTATAQSNRINVVAAGADPTGEENIVPVLREVIEDGATLFFPGGEYLVDVDGVREDNPSPSGNTTAWYPRQTHGPISSLTLQGTSGTRIVCENPDMQTAFLIGPWIPDSMDMGPETLTVDNFTFDFTTEGVGPKALIASARKRLELTNIEIEGAIPGEPEHGINRAGPVVEPRVFSEDGVGRINLVARDGCTWRPDKYSGGLVDAMTSHPIGINMHYLTRGEVYFENCDIRNFVNNGFYLVGSNGTSHVRNSYFKDNGGASVRLGEGDTAKDITIEMTSDGNGNEVASTGLWHQYGAPVSENVKVIATGGHPNADPVRLAGGTLRNANVRADVISAFSAGRDNAAIRNHGDSPDHAVTLENVTVWDDLENRPEDLPGRADTGKAISLTYDSSDDQASDHVIRDCCVEQSERGGIRLDSGLIENTTAIVPDDEEAFDITDEVELVNVSEDGSCTPNRHLGASRAVSRSARPRGL